MQNKKQSKKTYTQSQVNDLMWYALRQHDKNLDDAMEGLVANEEFCTELNLILCFLPYIFT